MDRLHGASFTCQRDRSISRARTQVSLETWLTDTNCGRSEKIYPRRTCNWLINSCALRHVARSMLRTYVSLAANEIIHIGNSRELVRERLQFRNCRFLSRYVLPERLKIFTSFFSRQAHNCFINMSQVLAKFIRISDIWTAFFERASGLALHSVREGSMRKRKKEREEYRPIM